MTQFNPMGPTNPSENSREKLNISTTGLTFFNDEQMMLQVSFLNQSLSFTFRKGVTDPMSGTTRYPKAESGSPSTLLTSDIAATFYELLTTDFMPWYASGKACEEAHSVGVFTNKNKSTIIDMYAGPDTRYPQLRLFAKINESNIPAETYIYTLKPNAYIGDYHIECKNYKVDEIDGQLLMILKSISTFLEAVTRADQHVEAFGTAYDRNRVYEYLTKIGNRVGLMDTLYSVGKSQNNGYSNNSGFSQNFNNVAMNNPMASMQPDNSTPPIAKVGSMEDLLPV